MSAAKIKKGDQVIVLAGRDKGKKGEVYQVMPREGRALVRGVNMMRRHQRQTPSQEGGIIAKSLAAASTFLRSFTASPMPMLRTIFSTRGICMRFL